MVSTLYILFLVLKIHKKNQTSFLENMPLDVLEVFTILLDNNHISCIIKLSKFCQSLWSDMRNEFKCESAIQTDFIIFQVTLQNLLLNNMMIKIFKNK